MTGTIKRLVRGRGFGFIRDDAGIEFFFHRSAVVGVSGTGYDALQEGERVAFEEQDGGAKGPRAINVQPW